MTYAVTLRVLGLNLGRAEHVEAVAQIETQVGWASIDGLVTATLYVEGHEAPAAVSEAAAVAAIIMRLVPGSIVPYFYDELVTVREIANRCGVAVESARLWSTGKRRHNLKNPFPAPRQVLETESKAMRLFAWREVVNWVRAECRIEPEDDLEFITDADIASLNFRLAAQTRTVTSKLAAPVFYAMSKNTTGWSRIQPDFEFVLPHTSGHQFAAQGPAGVWTRSDALEAVHSLWPTGARHGLGFELAPDNSVGGSDLDRELRRIVSEP